MSSLSQQLQSISSKTQSLALDRKARSKIHSRSLIFEPKIASAQDYDYIYQIGLEGLEELTEIDSRFNKFKNTLFSETSINFDRNVQPQETVDQLGRNIDAFLTLVGPYYAISPSLKALEWLVRRFYINIHNSEMLLITSLPHYKNPIFVKVLNVIPKNQLPKIFGWISGYKDLLKSPTEASLFKAFYNDLELFKLYSMFLMDQIKNKTIYKEQLVFYLSNTVNIMAAHSREVEKLNENQLPIILEVIGTLLSPQKPNGSLSGGNDARLTAYSLISVLGSILPLTKEVIKSLTECILQSEPFGSSSKQTLIVLGQLWNFYSEDSYEFDCFKDLPVSSLLKDNIIESIKTENYKIERFLLIYIVSTLPSVETFKLIPFVNWEKSNVFYNLLFDKITFLIQSNDETTRKCISEVFDHLLKVNKELFDNSLERNGLKLSELEIKLMTTFGNHDSSQDADIEFESDDVENNNDEELEITDDVNASFETLKTKTISFFECGNEEYQVLANSLIQALSNMNLKAQRSVLMKFSKIVFPSLESAMSFLFRFAYSPGIPLAFRLSVLRFIRIRIKQLSESENKEEFYLLVPILLLGLNSTSKAFRGSIIEILRLINEISISTHSNKKKAKTILYMEEQIYGSWEPSQRAIIAPNDNLSMLEILFETNVLEDVLIDNARINNLIFNKLFKSSKASLKKFGQLIIKTFVINQWSLPFWPLVFKSRVWDIMSVENQSGSDDRYFFIDTDIEEYMKRRDNLKIEASSCKIDFENDVERKFVSIIGGRSTHEKNKAREVDWLLNALEEEDESLQNIANERLISIFSTIKALDLKATVINKYTELLVKDTDIYFDAIASLQAIEIDHDLMMAILGNVQIVTQIPEQGVAKRRRRSSNSTKQAMAREDINSMASTHLTKLTIVLDTLEYNLRNKNTDISRPDLLQSLFKSLTDLDYLGNEGNLPVIYAQETLASCMLLSIQNIKQSEDTFEFDSSSIRADLIVNSIRSSQSPQVQNRLLLVIAELASLAPEIVLHSVMPIFTFMGAHTIRQDDEFSSSALQQTISKVIPAIAANGSNSLSNEIEFLLTSFVTAFHHIPRHRRVKLFTSLTKTLSHERSLSIILFLMGQQYAFSASKNKITKADAVIEFTLSFLKSFTASEQLVGLSSFYDLWNDIPIKQLEANSEEYDKLSKRCIFGTSILSLNNAELKELKVNMLKFMLEVLKLDQQEFNGIKSLKLKISLVLLDDVPQECKDNILQSSQQVISFALANLNEFTVNYDEDILNNLYKLLNQFLDLLPLKFFIDAILDSMKIINLEDVLSLRIARNFAVLAGTKFETELNANNIDEDIQNSVLNKMLPVLLEGIERGIDIELVQSYLDTFAIIVNKFGSSTRELTNDENSKVLINSLNVITSTNGLLNELSEIIISSINAISSVFNVLGVKAIGFFPKVIPPALKIWESTKSSEEESSKLLQTSILLLFSCLVKKIPAFMTSKLDDIFLVILNSNLIANDIRSNALNLIVDHMDLSQVLKSLCNIWCKNKFYHNDSAGNLGLYLNILQLTIDNIEKKSAAVHSTLFMKWLIEAFEFRSYCEKEGKFDNNTIHRLESSFHSCGISYVMKLNDKVFRPLFANLVRWAVDGEGSVSSDISEISRLLAFFRFFNKLQDGLKSIITSYYSYLLEAVSSLLKRFESGDIVDVNLRRIILSSLTNSCKFDQDDYWSQQLRYDTICEPLLSQLSNIEDSIGKYLVKCISAFVNNVSSDEYNEALVRGLIIYISNDNEKSSSKSKIWTIRTLKSIFQKMGEQWLTYLPTLIPYIAELLEDDDEAVELEVRSGLVRVIENVLGEPLDRYLD